MRSAARALRPGLLLACFAGAGPGTHARAEDNCGRMVESVVRLRGTIRTIEQLGQREQVITPVGDTDMRFVVALAVESSDRADVVQRGTTYNFGLHSPARTFGADVVGGSTLDLALATMHCDGVFRRFLELRRLTASPVQKFSGHLEVGATYRAAALWDPEHGTILAERLRPPMHHLAVIEWLDSEEAPKLGPARRSATVTFEVVARETERRGEWEWRTTYKCAFVLK